MAECGLKNVRELLLSERGDRPARVLPERRYEHPTGMDRLPPLAGLSCIANFCLRAHHVSDTTENLVVGVHRLKWLEQETTGNEGTPLSVLNSTTESDL